MLVLGDEYSIATFCPASTSSGRGAVVGARPLDEACGHHGPVEAEIQESVHGLRTCHEVDALRDRSDVLGDGLRCLPEDARIFVAWQGEVAGPGPGRGGKRDRVGHAVLGQEGLQRSGDVSDEVGVKVGGHGLSARCESVRAVIAMAAAGHPDRAVR